MRSRAVDKEGVGRESPSPQESATAAVETISREGWLIAYPGNDPLLADEGLASFKKAVYDNQKKVQEALAK